MIDKVLFSFHTTVACIVLLLIVSYFIDSVSNVPSVQYLTQEVYGNLGIGDNITKEMSTQASAPHNITAGGSSDDQIQQSIGNMTEVPVNKINSTNLIAISPEVLQPKQVGNDTTNRTVIVIPPQPVQSKQTLNEPSIIGPPRTIQSKPQGIIESGDTRVNISAIKPITKEQAAKAEQDANVIIKAYYEKVKQEEEEKSRQEAAALVASQANQSATESPIEGEESEDSKAMSTDDTETNGEGEDDDQEERDNEDGDGNEDDNQDEGEEE